MMIMIRVSFILLIDYFLFSLECPISLLPSFIPIFYTPDELYGLFLWSPPLSNNWLFYSTVILWISKLFMSINPLGYTFVDYPEILGVFAQWKLY